MVLALLAGMLLAIQNGSPTQARPGLEIIEGPATVVAGDTLRVGGHTVRLVGLQAEDAAVRILEEGLAEAEDLLRLLVDQNQPQYAGRHPVRCHLIGREGPTFAGRCERLIPACVHVTCEDVWYDLADHVVENGGGRRRDETL